MRLLRSVAVFAGAVLVGAGLAGCVPGWNVEAKTAEIVRELTVLPGVITVTSMDQEPIYPLKSASSDVKVTLEPAISESELLTILTTFDEANRSTGTSGVSTRLTAVIGEGDTRDDLVLDVPKPEKQQLDDLARLWGDLREHFGGADIGLVESDPRPPSFEVGVAIDADAQIDVGARLNEELQALRDVTELFGAVGPVSTVSVAGSRLQVTQGLPSEESLAVAAQIGTTPGVENLAADFGSTETTFSVRVAEDAAVDPALGVSAPMAAVVDAIPAGGSAVHIEFEVDVAFFDNDSCLRYGLHPEDTVSRALLEYWTRDGRTLLDGSTAASCFA